MANAAFTLTVFPDAGFSAARAKRRFQSELTEAAIKKFKALCAELQIPYRYVELPVALKSVVTAEYLSAGSASSPQANSGQAAENAE